MTLARPMIVLAVLNLAAVSPALAQPSEPDVLRGPRVHEASAAAKTLVRRDMSGKLTRLETRPEAAAVGLLGLTAPEREAADKVLADRNAKVTALLKDHLDLFLKIQAGRQGGASRQEILPLMTEFRTAAAGLLEKPFVDQVASSLPEARRPDYRRIVDEYKKALAEEGPEVGAPREAAPPPPGSRRAQERQELSMLLRETGRALKAIVDERRARTEELFKAIDATPEQQSKIQAILRDRPGKGAGEPTQEERAAQWKRTMDILTPEQRQKAMELRRGK